MVMTEIEVKEDDAAEKEGEDPKCSENSCLSLMQKHTQESRSKRSDGLHPRARDLTTSSGPSTAASNEVGLLEWRLLLRTGFIFLVLIWVKSSFGHSGFVPYGHAMVSRCFQ